MYGLADSPVALAAWMFNHDAASCSDIAAAFAGHPRQPRAAPKAGTARDQYGFRRAQPLAHERARPLAYSLRPR
jgi:hypothetical protein